ncbi:alkaline phosphatase family protein, partial [Streptomyces sp. NPDC060322]
MTSTSTSTNPSTGTGTNPSTNPSTGTGTEPVTRPTPLLVLDVVGLTPQLLRHMPNLRAMAASGAQAPLSTVLPAVTCAAQSTFLTGITPAEHGIVANGWYFRELGDVLLWRQHNGLVEGDKLWDAARRAHPGYTVANVCWWYAMGADTDWTVTPRPVYYADGRKEPDCYTRPPALHDELTEKLGTFPLFHFWGPGADL